jgi:inosose dehydratase
MSVKLGAAPITWGVESADDPRNPSAEFVLSQSAEAGYQGCELGAPGFFGSQAESINRRFAHNSLDAVAFWMDIPLDKPLTAETSDSLGRTCKLLADVNAQHLIVSDLLTAERMTIVGRVSQFPQEWWIPDQCSQAKATLLQIQEIATRHERVLSVHPHVGGHIETGDEIEELLNCINGTTIGLCVDTGHVSIGGSDPVQLLESQFARVRILHAKDVDESVLSNLQAGELTYEEAVAAGLYSDLGNGLVDWAGYRDALHRNQYDGWVIAEQDALSGYSHDRASASNTANYLFLNQLLNADDASS